MKKLFSLIALLAITLGAQAQFSQGSSFGSVIKSINAGFTAGSAPFQVDGGAVTNIAITNAVLIPIGANGVAITVVAGSTNALTITNCSAVFGLIPPGQTNVSTTLRYAFHFAPNGTSRAIHMTNFSPSIYAANTSPLVNLGNAANLRLLSITNNNGTLENIFITNLIWSTR